MKNKYKGLAEYLVKKDQYLALNLEQAKYIVKLVKAFEKEQSNLTIIKYPGKKPKLKKLSKKQQLEYDKLVESIQMGFDKALKDMLK